MRQEGEASVEEILDSIKKVIARDNRAGAMEERRRRESAGLQEDRLQTIAAAITGEAQTVAAQSGDDEVLDLSTADFVEQADGYEDVGNAASADPGGDIDEVPLTADPLRDAMRENFAALAMLAKPGAQPQIVRSGETSLEGLARDLLRPMLAEWLDANLPGMVEKMVQAEIARIAGKRS